MTRFVVETHNKEPAIASNYAVLEKIGLAKYPNITAMRVIFCDLQIT